MGQWQRITGTFGLVLLMLLSSVGLQPTRTAQAAPAMAGPEALGVLQQSADVVQRHLAQPSVTIAPEQRFAVFPEAWWGCMPLPLSPKIGFGINVTVLPYWSATLRTTYL